MTVNTATLARISNNDLYGCNTGYQDYPSLKGLIDAQSALVTSYIIMQLFQLRDHSLFMTGGGLAKKGGGS